MTPVEAAAVAAVRAHAEKHVKSGRATYSTPAIQLLLELLDELMKRPDWEVLWAEQVKCTEHADARIAKLEAGIKAISELAPTSDSWISHARALLGGPDMTPADVAEPPGLVEMRAELNYQRARAEKGEAALVLMIEHRDVMKARAEKAEAALAVEQAQVLAALQERDDLAVALAEKAARR